MSFALNPTDFGPYGITTSTASPLTTDPSPPPVTSPKPIAPLFSPRSFTHPIPPSRLLPHTLRRASQVPSFSRPTTRKQYTRLLPALTLATHFLTHSLPFLHTIRNTPLTSTFVNGRRKEHFQHPVQSFSSAQKDQISAQLAALVRRIRYLIAFPAAMLEASADTIPLRASWTPAAVRTSPRRTNPSASGLQMQAQTASEEHFHYVTSLPRELLDLLGSNDWDVLDQGARQRVLFMLAVTLVHELVHALFWERERVEKGTAGDQAVNVNANPEEPYFRPEDLQRELGEAWERWVFGGVLEMPFDCDFLGPSSTGVVWGVDGVRMPTYALRWRAWVDDGGYRGAVKRLAPWDEDERWLLTSSGVEEYFDEKRWERFAEMVENVDARVAVREAVEGPFQVSFAPLRTGNTILMDRGADDNRSADQRRRPEGLFDVLLERCAAGEFGCLPRGG